MTYRDLKNYKIFIESELYQKKSRDIKKFIYWASCDFNRIFRSDIPRKEYFAQLALADKKKQIVDKYENNSRLLGIISWLYSHSKDKHAVGRKINRQS